MTIEEQRDGDVDGDLHREVKASAAESSSFFFRLEFSDEFILMRFDWKCFAVNFFLWYYESRGSQVCVLVSFCFFRYGCVFRVFVST
mmetsp:Transcript_5985/g.11326  ORF Transcript_5985/g.11326 Transcript_5985/m.11326 type:complete len:87 (-) Transcript_5985:3817-4077(-)